MSIAEKLFDLVEQTQQSLQPYLRIETFPTGEQPTSRLAIDVILQSAFEQAIAAHQDDDKEERYYWPDGSLKWTHPLDVGHLILQLQTLDPKMEVSSVTFINRADGSGRKARAYGLSMSRERWGDSLWLDWKIGGPEKLAIWATVREPEIQGLAPEAKLP